MKLASLIALALVLPSIARAEPSTPKRKNPDTALWLSLGGYAGSLALIGTGVALEHSSTGTADTIGNRLILVGSASSLVTPALGHWYAGRYVTTGLVMRGAAVGLGAVGLVMLDDCGESCTDYTGAAVLLLGATTLSFVGTMHDLATARDAAHDFNRRQLAVTPIVTRTAGAGTYGVGVGGAF